MSSTYGDKQKEIGLPTSHSSFSPSPMQNKNTLKGDGK